MTKLMLLSLAKQFSNVITEWVSFIDVENTIINKFEILKEIEEYKDKYEEAVRQATIEKDAANSYIEPN